MDIARYVVATLILISLPSGLLLWLVIHPFVTFWRRLGPTRTYAILSIPVAAVMVTTFLMRRRLLAEDFGTNYFLVATAFVALLGGFLIARRRRKHLTFTILAGLPELSSARYPGTLLREGIYASIRHPRYVETALVVLAYALFANFLGTYVLLVATLPTLYVIVLLEERELRTRFGAEYVAYCRAVPRFVPRRRATHFDPESL